MALKPVPPTPPPEEPSHEAEYVLRLTLESVRRQIGTCAQRIDHQELMLRTEQEEMANLIAKRDSLEKALAILR